MLGRGPGNEAIIVACCALRFVICMLPNFGTPYLPKSPNMCICKSSAGCSHNVPNDRLTVYDSVCPQLLERFMSQNSQARVFMNPAKDLVECSDIRAPHGKLTIVYGTSLIPRLPPAQ